MLQFFLNLGRAMRQEFVDSLPRFRSNKARDKLPDGLRVSSTIGEAYTLLLEVAYPDRV